MLGVTTNPLHTPADEVMREVAEQMGVGGDLPAHAGRRVLRRPGEGRPTVPDPFFGGEGPERNPCRTAASA